MPSCILNLFSWNGKGKCFKMMDLTLFSQHTLMQYLQSQNIPVSGKLVRHFRSWLIVVMNQNCYLLKYNWHWQENFDFLKMLTASIRWYLGRFDCTILLYSHFLLLRILPPPFISEQFWIVVSRLFSMNLYAWNWNENIWKYDTILV